MELTQPLQAEQAAAPDGTPTRMPLDLTAFTVTFVTEYSNITTTLSAQAPQDDESLAVMAAHYLHEELGVAPELGDLANEIIINRIEESA